MAVHNNAAIFLTKSALPSAFSLPSPSCKTKRFRHGNDSNNTNTTSFNVDFGRSVDWRGRGKGRGGVRLAYALGAGNGNGGSGDLASSKKKSVPNSNYVVPMDKSFASSSYITRPLVEILRDLNKRIPDNIIKPHSSSTLIPWYHANRMLSFYAPGWCGEIRNVILSENGSVTVVYRVTILGSDGEAHRESTGTVSLSDGDIEDPVAAAEELAFCRACARFGLGLYLYHEE